MAIRGHRSPADASPTDSRPRTLDEIDHVDEVTRERIGEIESKLGHPSRSERLRNDHD
jgi:DNA-directed RNA polymerase sigma subunit (sigma70/sigma32)